MTGAPPSAYVIAHKLHEAVLARDAASDGWEWTSARGHELRLRRELAEAEGAKDGEGAKGAKGKQARRRDGRKQRNADFERSHPRGRGGQWTAGRAGPAAKRLKPPPGDEQLARRFIAAMRSGDLYAIADAKKAIRARTHSKSALHRFVGRAMLGSVASALGTSLHLYDVGSPLVDEHLFYLSLAPRSVLETVARSGRQVYIGDRPVTDFPPAAPLRGVAAPGHPGETWDTIGGVTWDNYVLIGRDLGGGEATIQSVALHEIAHAYDRVTGLSDDPAFAAIHDRYVAEGRLQPYYAMPEDAGAAGRKEYFADVFVARYLDPREQSDEWPDPYYDEIQAWARRRLP